MIDRPLVGRTFDSQDRIWSKDVRECTKHGIFFEDLRHVSGSRRDWRLCFKVRNNVLSTDEIKELVTSYLQSAFCGFNAKFYRSKDLGLYVVFDIETRS